MRDVGHRFLRLLVGHLLKDLVLVVSMILLNENPVRLACALITSQGEGPILSQYLGDRSIGF